MRGHMGMTVDRSRDTGRSSRRVGRLGAAAIALALLALPGCGWIGDRVSGVGSGVSRALGLADDGGLPYRAAARAGEDRRDIVVTVRVPAGVPLEEFRESARFAATRYCIDTFGSSEAEWTIDPATGDWAASRTETAAALGVRCTGS
jgi:hypothetical protein